MVSRLWGGGVLGMALLMSSTGAYAETIGGAVHQTLSGDILEDLLGDLGGFLIALLGVLI